jgi:hypothetical protein
MSARIPYALACTLCLALSLALAGHASASPRTDTDAVAKAIEDNFYDVARGKSIANDLRASAAKGDFDTYNDNRELAAALTDRLKPLDTHFNVQWSPPTAKDDKSEGDRRPQQGPPASHGTQHGIRRVEILPGNIGYIDLRQFADFEFGKPDQPARQAIEAALQLIAGTDAVIVDLRANGGGSPAMVGYLTSAFTPKGADIYNTFHRRQGTDSEAPTDWFASPRLQVPLYVLESARTGSAAEAFAYTVKNAKRATIVGEASAGAANPGGEVDAGNGFRVFVSNGTPISPITGKNWEGDGVIPDVQVASSQALETARGLALEKIVAERPANETTEARWALDGLRAEAQPRQSGNPADYVGGFGSMTIAEDNGRLVIKRGRRPVVVLLPLGGDVFTVAADPTLRLTFARDGKRAVDALEVVGLDGRSSRFRRNAGP